jgi:hypothetical protein
MQSNHRNSKSATEHSLLEEMAATGNSKDRELVLHLLCEQAPPVTGDAPPMPEDLRKKLEAKYGRETALLGKTEQVSLFAWIFRVLKNPVAITGLAAACVAVLFFLPTAKPPGQTMEDTTRATQTAQPAVQNGLQWVWLGSVEPSIAEKLGPQLGKANLTIVASLVAVDPQSGAWLRKAGDEPKHFPASGAPSDPTWPEAVAAAAKLAASEAP